MILLQKRAHLFLETPFTVVRCLPVNVTHERANVRLLPSSIATPEAEWISFARVFSAADTARQAVNLGGRILVGPTREAHGATSSILEDPTGAVFGVIELPPEVVKIETP